MQKVNGNLDGIRRSYIDKLQSIYDMAIDRREFITAEIVEALVNFTNTTGREAMVYLDRAGRVHDITVGTSDRVALTAMTKRRSESRLSGIRCIHTHPGGNPHLSQIDIETLKTLKLDAMASIGSTESNEIYMQVAILDEITADNVVSVNIIEPFKVDRISNERLWDEIEAADMRIRPGDSKKAEAEIARAILIGIDGRSDKPLIELKQLADTAGFITVGFMVQPKSKPDKSFYFGYGKLQELILEIQRLNADAIIFDDELTPSQIRNIQKEIGKKEIIDRTALILDIFSNRASTHEGRLQVELAHTKYLLPRMAHFWGHFNRMGGGGSGGGGSGARRGEGETQLEVDRRLLRRRVDELEREINKIKSRREVQRTARERKGIPIVSLVGYTNAGKSTLMNALSGSDVLAEDKLFATLDTVSRRVNYGSGEFLLVDTVGFINKLPHDLVNAFRATLEEARFADLLLHVVDSSSEDRLQQIDVVNDVLTELEAVNKPTLMVYNKCDITDDSLKPLNEENNIAISAITGLGMDSLKDAITKKLAEMRQDITVLLPLDAGSLLSRIYTTGEVHSCEYQEDAIKLTATVSMEDLARLQAIAIG